jgi:ketosteroid isomerase-like protein
MNRFETPEGAELERGALILAAMHADALTRFEFFEAEQLDEALARFAEVAPGTRGPSTENLASFSTRRRIEALVRRDWEAIANGLAPDVVEIDRRRGFHTELVGKEAVLAGAQALVSVLGSGRVAYSSLATRGEQLALGSIRFGSPDIADGEWETENLVLTHVDSEGLQKFRANFDLDDLDAAYAELDDRWAATSQLPFIPMARELVDSYNTRDWIRFRATLTDDFVVDDHRPASLGRLEGPDAWIAALRPLTDLIPDSRWRVTHAHEIAPDLVLCSLETGGTTPEGARVDISTHGVVTLRDGLLASNEIFPFDRFDAAKARFEELRHQESTTAIDLENRAVRTGRRFQQLFAERDWNGFGALLTEDSTFEDRRVGMRFTISGREARVQNMRTIVEVGARRATFTPLATRGELLALYRMFVRGDDPGQDFQVEMLQLDEYDDRGLLALTLTFDPEDLEGAFAELDERFMAGEGAPRSSLTNGAASVAERNWEAIERGDIESHIRLHADDASSEDRRSGLKNLSVGKDAVADEVRVLLSLNVATSRWTTVATRGDRLALGRVLLEARDFTGEVLQIVEIDEDGLISAWVSFDPDDLDAAYVELDDRYAGGEGAAFVNVQVTLQSLSAWNARDWEGMAAWFDPNIVFVDHRPTYFGEVKGRDAVMSLIANLLTPDVRHDVVALPVIGPHGMVSVLVARGTNSEGGIVEVSYLSVIEAPDGTIKRHERFAVEDLPAAIARFEELGEGRDKRLLENSATRFLERLHDAFERQDMNLFTDLHTGGFVHDDRRAGLRHVVRGIDEVVEYGRTQWDVGARSARNVETLAIRGDLLSLTRRLYSDPGSDSNFEIEQLIVDEVDSDGRVVHATVFEPDDLDAAFVELDDRYVAHEGSRYADVWRVRRGLEAYNARDWAGYRAAHTPDCVLIDHRPASAGRIDGIEDRIEYFRTMTELVPDLRWDVTQIHAIDQEKLVASVRVHGQTKEGSQVELSAHVFVRVLDGRQAHTELFPAERLDAALARFDELGSAEPSTRHLENEATAMAQRFDRAFSQRDWEALADVWSDDLVRDDRRQGLGGVAGKAAVVDAWRVMAELGYDEVRRETIATRGVRLSLQRTLATGSHGFETEALTILETDVSGRAIRAVYFDRHDLDAAFAELDEMYMTGEGAACADNWRLHLEAFDAHAARDWERYSAVSAPDVVFVDHRPASLGRIEGAVEYQRHVRALADIAPDVRIRAVAVHSIDESSVAYEVANTATNESGGPVEFAFQVICLMRGGLVKAFEYFPVDQLDAALQRLEALKTQAADKI